MNDKEAVRCIEPNACIEKHDDGWLVRKHPEGRALGGGKTPGRAWHSARMTLFAGTIAPRLAETPGSTLDYIPVTKK